MFQDDVLYSLGMFAVAAWLFKKCGFQIRAILCVLGLLQKGNSLGRGLFQ